MSLIFIRVRACNNALCVLKTTMLLPGLVHAELSRQNRHNQKKKLIVYIQSYAYFLAPISNLVCWSVGCSVSMWEKMLIALNGLTVCSYRNKSIIGSFGLILYILPRLKLFWVPIKYSNNYICQAQPQPQLQLQLRLSWLLFYKTQPPGHPSHRPPIQ